MAKESWGKKHICPFCQTVFYDMKKEVIVCPKCSKNLTTDQEMDYLKKQKKVEVEMDNIETLKVDDDSVDISESEMFFDMGEEDTSVDNSNYYSDEEDY